MKSLGKRVDVLGSKRKHQHNTKDCVKETLRKRQRILEEKEQIRIDIKELYVSQRQDRRN